ncbi:amidohydrolase family protein [soil metagenome]
MSILRQSGHPVFRIDQTLPIRLIGILLVFISTVAFPQEGTKIPITVHEGTNMAAAVSPDAKTIAVDLQGTIGTVSIEGGEVKLLTDGMGDERQPSWSPDGSKIVFHSYRDGGYHIWTINKDGSDLKQITFGMFDEREPHWSPDGTKIVFSTDRSGNYDIWEMNVATSEFKQLTTDPANDYHPSYASDSKQIAFISVRPKGGVWIINESGEEKLIVPLKGTFNSPAWSPDRKIISFNAFDKGKSHLVLVTVATGELKTISPENEDVFQFRATWLSDKELIYTGDGKIQRKVLDKPVSSIPFTAALTLLKPTYQKRQRDFDSEAPKKVLGVFGPVVSPDGNSIAFTALGDIWLLKQGDPKPAQITKDIAMDIDPEWSHDGKKLAFVSDRNGTNMNIWIRDIQSGSEKQITTLNRHALQPSFSPDGKKIAFILNDGVVGFGTSTLQVIDLETGVSKTLYKALFTPGKPTWSADGKLVALEALQPYSSRFREGLSRILIVPINGDASRFVTPVEGRSLGQRGKSGPLWSPDGHKMAYLLDGVLWVITVDATGQPVGPATRLTNESSDAPSWTGDSQSLVFLATDNLKKVRLSDGMIETIPLSLQWTPKKNHDSYVIYAGKIFDGRSATYQKNMDIVIEGNRIKEIVPHKAGRTGTVIDASDKTVMPGLIEMHTHQNGSAGEMVGRNWLAYGITSVRETGGDPFDALERKESWSSGARIGPREFFTGPLLEGGRIYYELASTVATPLQLDMELKKAAALEYDFIKTYVRFPDYFQKRATAFAHEHGIPVSSHEIYPATAYGVDAVEHMSATSRRGYSPKLTAMNRNYDDVVQILSKSGMNMTATVALYGGFSEKWLADPEVSGNRQLNALYTKEYVSSVSAFIKQMATVRSTDGFDDLEKTLVKMVNAGVRITAGTDSPFITYGLSLQIEMQNFVDAGLTPFQALRSATSYAAEAIGVEKDLGTVEAGKLADLVIVKGDPLKNIKDALSVEVVFKNGIRYDIETLLKR